VRSAFFSWIGTNAGALASIVARMGFLLPAAGLLALGAPPGPAPAPAPAPQDAFVNWETPHVHPLDLTPDRARLLAVNLPDNRLEVFDVTSGTAVWLRSIPVGLDPVSVRARSNTEAWVVNQLSDSVSVVDLVLGRVVDTLATADEPADVVFAGDLGFVSCSQANRVLVFDAEDRGAAPRVVPIAGEDPRALAVSPDGRRVYVAVFESGNRTTVIGNGGFVPLDFPLDVVGAPIGPHGGLSPTPNTDTGFEPPLGPALPRPPSVAQIIAPDANGRWRDDTGGDWTLFVSGSLAHSTGRRPGWRLLDHDLALVDVETLGVTYATGLMNLCMALAVDPVTGMVAVVGTDATNTVRFEPNLAGRFLRVRLARVDPAAPAASLASDLNPHLDYAGASAPAAERGATLSDPRGIVWNAEGTRVWVTGLGTNNVVVLEAAGGRAGLAPDIDVGAGPTGIVLDEPRQRAYVLNRFDATISVLGLAEERELARVPFFDPTPAAIRAGRPLLYDARATSGLGLTSCAACHVDGRMDRLAWDLGDPSAAMEGLDGLNLGANIPGLSTNFVDFHPMKGPMLTQTLQDIVGTEPFHWRGDRLTLASFAGAFPSLLGADVRPGPAAMQAFEDFLATIVYPPNPHRELDNTLSTHVPLEGMHTPGRFAPPGQPMPAGDAVRGRVLYQTPVRFACDNCHTLPTGLGTNWNWNGSAFEPLTPAPGGAARHAVLPPSFQIEQNFKVPQLRNLYERTGFDGTVADNTAGFGFRHDGAVDSLPRFVARAHFVPTSDQELADLVAFLLSLSGEPAPAVVPLDDFARPPGTPGRPTHAAVGRQLTLAGPVPSPAAGAVLDVLMAEARQGEIGLVARGRLGGLERSAYFVGPRFQTDRAAERVPLAALLSTASPGSELTFTAVPRGSERRIGVDRDADGAYDRDELDHGSNPADPRSLPRFSQR
jgi:DNA-binding beta-propeller fold protein YncE